MAINTGRLTTRLGKLVGWLNELNTYRGTTLFTRADTVYAEYATVNPDLVGGLYAARDGAVAAFGGQVSYIKSLAQNVIIEEVENDRPLPSRTLANAVAEWDRQMRVAGDTFNASPCAIAVTDIGVPVGDVSAVTTGKDGSAVEQDLILPDSYLVTVTADKDHGGTKWAETVTIRGKAADAATSDPAYPAGTGINTTKAIINPASSGGIVTDGTFGSWNSGSPNALTSWPIGTGCTYAVQAIYAADDPRDGGSGTCLTLKGDGVAIPSVHQTVTVVAERVYAVHLRIKKVNDPGTDWKVTVRLTDGSGTALANCTLTSGACTGLAADWTNVLKGVFITPATLPATVYLEVKLHDTSGVSVAPVNLSEVKVDHLSATLVADPLYAGGPRVAFFSGLAASVQNDARTVAVTVAGTYDSYLLTGIDRLVGLKALGAHLPSDAAAGETISDSLVS